MVEVLGMLLGLGSQGSGSRAHLNPEEPPFLGFLIMLS